MFRKLHSDIKYLYNYLIGLIGITLLLLIFLCPLFVKAEDTEESKIYPYNPEYAFDINDMSHFSVLHSNDTTYILKLDKQNLTIINTKDRNFYKITTKEFDTENNQISFNEFTSNIILIKEKKEKNNGKKSTNLYIFDLSKFNNTNSDKDYSNYFYKIECQDHDSKPINTRSDHMIIKDITEENYKIYLIEHYGDIYAAQINKSDTENLTNPLTFKMEKNSKVNLDENIKLIKTNNKNIYVIKSDSKIYKLNDTEDSVIELENGDPFDNIKNFQIIGENCIYIRKENDKYNLYTSKIKDEIIFNNENKFIDTINTNNSIESVEIKIINEKSFILSIDNTAKIYRKNSDEKFEYTNEYYSLNAKYSEDLSKLNNPFAITSINNGDSSYVTVADKVNDEYRIISYKLINNKINEKKLIFKTKDKISQISSYIENEEIKIIISLLSEGKQNIKIFDYNKKTQEDKFLNISINIDAEIKNIKFQNNTLFIIYVEKNIPYIISKKNNENKINSIKIMDSYNENILFSISNNNMLYSINKDKKNLKIYLISSELKELAKGIKNDYFSDIDSFIVAKTGDLISLANNEILLFKRTSLNTFENPKHFKNKIPDGAKLNLISQNNKGYIYTLSNSHHFFALSNTTFENLNIEDSKIEYNLKEPFLIHLKDNSILFRTIGDYETSLNVSKKDDDLALVLSEKDDYFYIITNTGKFGFINKTNKDGENINLSREVNYKEVETIHDSMEEGDQPLFLNKPFHFINASLISSYDFLSNEYNNYYNNQIKPIFSNNNITKLSNIKKFEIAPLLSTSDVIWQKNIEMVRLRIYFNDGTYRDGYSFRKIFSVPSKDKLIIGKAGKIQTTTIGKTANLYKDPNQSSEVLCTLEDGTDLVMQINKSLKDIDSEFIMVQLLNPKNGATIGYIKKSELTQNRITITQRNVIIIVFISLAFTIFVLLLMKYKKKKDINDILK